jgi:hypothetical protein
MPLVGVPSMGPRTREEEAQKAVEPLPEEHVPWVGPQVVEKRRRGRRRMWAGEGTGCTRWAGGWALDLRTR